MIDINGKLINPQKVSFVSPNGVAVIDSTMQYLSVDEVAHLRRLLVPGELPMDGINVGGIMFMLTDLGYAGMAKIMEGL